MSRGAYLPEPLGSSNGGDLIETRISTELRRENFNLKYASIELGPYNKYSKSEKETSSVSITLDE
jgi:hypothetical protein